MTKKFSRTFILVVIVAMFIAGVTAPQTASAKPVLAAITTSVDSQAKSGIPGSVVAYTLTLNNNDAADAPLTLEASTAGGWPVPSIVPSSLTVGANASQAVIINVPIPATATSGQNDVATILVKDATSTVVATVLLTTTAQAPAVSGRPLVAVNSYSSSPNPIKPYQEFTLSVVFENRGQSPAYNLVVTFDGADLYPRGTGGVSTIGNLDPGGRITFTQTFLAGGNLSWQEAAAVKASAVYSDSSGTAYTEVFNLTLGITAPAYAAATATPKAQVKPQLVITGIQSDVDPLQPGSIFNLKLSVTNLGKVDAHNVTMVLGGGVTAEQGGTPQPGVSGSGGDLTNFAPLGSSNLVFIGDIKQGTTIDVTEKLVTNVSTQPGAYTLKVSFVYDDGKGGSLVDDQVITLLVYSLPQVEISFYRDPGMLTVGMPGTLPIQVTNLGKKTSVLGNMKVTVEGADLTNDISLVGALDSGGYYTLDTEIIPFQEGALNVTVTINYTDDFNQPRFITNTLSVDVMPAPEITDGLEGQDGMVVTPVVPVDTVPETFWAKLLRFFKGLFGLGSGKNETPVESIETVPTEEFYPSRPGKG
jgi:hypothetical protein